MTRRDNSASDHVFVPSLNDLVDDLVAANRILAGLAVVDAFGHVSARHPEHADRFLLSRSMAPDLVTAGDIMTLTSRAMRRRTTRAPYPERFIHAEIYARRPDVRAVVHSHATGVIPFSASSVPLNPIHYMSGFLHAARRSSRSASASEPPTCSCARARTGRRSPRRWVRATCAYLPRQAMAACRSLANVRQLLPCRRAGSR